LAISKARKDELVAQYTQLIKDSDGRIFIAEYKGMNVKSMEKLREDIAKADGAFHITKNTLLKIALEQADLPIMEDLLEGQIATSFALNEGPTLAKAMVNFADADDNLVIKGGIFSGNVLTVNEVEALAKMPSLDELRGQLIGLLNAPAQNIVSVVTNGVRQVINVIDAYAKSEEAAEAA
jgi:large subunit ribosomal protein L10